MVSKTRIAKYIVIIFIFFISNNSFSQAREYKFGKQGSRCFFTYLGYSPNNDYTSLNRPFVIIIGKADENSRQAYNNDTLKDVPSFHDYQFIYIPNRGIDANNKLQCLSSLTSLVSSDYNKSNSNLFLVIKDSTITKNDIADNGLYTIFRDVWFDFSSKNIEQNPSIESFFEESIIVNSDFDENAVYYSEEKINDNNDYYNSGKKSTKTYFGKPTKHNFTLSGTVRDKSTGESLPYANVLVKGSKNGAVTNSDGYFTLFKVPSDTSTLIIQYIGYEKTEKFLTPSINSKSLNIEIYPSLASLDEVVIMGNRQDVLLANKEKISVIKMTPKKLEQLPSMGEKDIMRSFQLMPGVSSANESSSGLYVRGGTPDQNLVTYDGFTVYHVDHLYGFFSAFNSNAIKDMQLYKGGFESKFGGRLSSVTEITGKDGNTNKFNIGGDLSLLSMNVFTEIPIGDKFSSVITFRRSYKGFLYDKIFEEFNADNEEDEEASKPAGGPGGMSQESSITSYFYDVNGKFTYRPNDKDIISLSIFNSADKLDNSTSASGAGIGSGGSNFNNNSTDLTKYGNLGSSVKWSRRWNEKLYGNTVVSFSNYFSDRDKSNERTTITDDVSTTTTSGIFENNDLKDYSIKSDYELDLYKFAKLQFGVFGTYYDIQYTYAESDTAMVLDKENKAILAGGYLQSQTKFFNNKLVFIPGIRSSYYQTTNKYYFEPRAALSYKITDKLTINSSAGKYYQFANRVTREDILSGSKDFWLLADDDAIPVSSSIHYIAGLSYDFNKYLFSVEAYRKDISDLTEYSLRFNPSPFGVSYEENFFSGQGFSQGVEFLVQKKSGKLNGWVSYSIGEAKNQFDVYGEDYYYANQNVSQEFKAVLMYKYKRWNFSTTWIYASGKPYTAPSGAYTVDLLDGTTETYFTVTDKNSLTLPDYHRLDVSVGYKLLGGKKEDNRRKEIGNISFSIFNIYNQTNVWYKQYTIEDDAILESDVNYLGITPNLTVSFKLR